MDINCFREVVQSAWDDIYHEDFFINLTLKHKMTKIVLTKWSKEILGDIFQQLVIREDIVKIKEELFGEFPTRVNRVVLKQAQAELIKYFKI